MSIRNESLAIVDSHIAELEEAIKKYSIPESVLTDILGSRSVSWAENGTDMDTDDVKVSQKKGKFEPTASKALGYAKVAV